MERLPKIEGTIVFEMGGGCLFPVGFSIFRRNFQLLTRITWEQIKLWS